MITTVKAFKTEDGQKFEDREEAETHALMLKIRGLIQSLTGGGSFTPTQIAQILTENCDTLHTAIGKYKKVVNSVRKVKEA